MNILISGASGLIGSHLSEYLISTGHDVYPLHRNPKSEKSNFWCPEENIIQLDESIKFDAVINLAGENIADSRWSKKKKAAIIDSRVYGTRLLAEAIAELKNPPSILISASAIGYYGDTGESIADEETSHGAGFLSEVAMQWEEATQAAEDAGIRTIHLRTGVVLSPDGGVLQKMLLPFKLGVGGIIGSGNQYMSWISIDDVVAIISSMLSNTQYSGPYNLVAPQVVSNYTFTKALGRVLHRPTFFPLPAFIVRLVFGEMGDALLLSSSRVEPMRLIKQDYSFIDKQLEDALMRLLK